jgi:uncharacterized protein YoxC
MNSNKSSTLVEGSGEATSSPPQDTSPHGRKPIGAIVIALVLAVVAIVLGINVRQKSAAIDDLQRQLNGTKSEMTSMQADLDKARADSSSLQLQMSKGTAQLSELRSQVAQDKSQLSDLQSKLDRANSRSAALQSQVSQTKSQADGLQTQLNQTADETARLRGDLDKAKSQNADLQSRLDKTESDAAKMQPAAVKAHQVPVTTSFKKAFWTGDYTMQVNNLNSAPLAVSITITGPGNNRTEPGTIDSGGNMKVNKLAVGDKVVIASYGYDPVTIAVQ